MQCYLIVAGGEPSIEAQARRPDGTWAVTTHAGLDAVVPLDVGGARVELRLSEVYDGVTFAA